jgi:hypothetical protein
MTRCALVRFEIGNAQIPHPFTGVHNTRVPGCNRFWSPYAQECPRSADVQGQPILRYFLDSWIHSNLEPTSIPIDQGTCGWLRSHRREATTHPRSRQAHPIAALKRGR